MSVSRVKSRARALLLLKINNRASALLRIMFFRFICDNVLELYCKGTSFF